MKSIDLGEFGFNIKFTQTLDLSAANTYVLYTKPDGTEGQWTATKDGTLSFFYAVLENDIDQKGIWILWPIAIWGNRLLWDRVSFRVKDAPISRIP